MAKSAPFAFLATLQSWQLKHLAYLTGLNSTGTKTRLQQLISERLIASPPSTSRCRILSIDMGVKNLAFCLLEVDRKVLNHEDADRERASHHSVSFQLSEWNRLDVTERLAAKNTTTPSPVDHALTTALEKETIDSTNATPDEPVNLYTPSSLSKVAVDLASEFVHYQPDYILIERQRFRSGGAPAIQEWTVRVNMLESMLWASLETMRLLDKRVATAQNRCFPQVLEMSPQRIGMFWLNRGNLSAKETDVAAALAGPKHKLQTAATGKRSYEKKDKIALARNWLCGSSDALKVGESLVPMVNTFCSPRSRQRPSQSKQPEKTSQREDTDASVTQSGLTLSGKLDDLADCLVQAMTFALWEQNRVNIKDYIESRE